MSKSEKNLFKKKSDFEYILSGQKSLSYTALMTEYMIISGLSEPSAKRDIGNATKDGWIIKGRDENYRYH